MPDKKTTNDNTLDNASNNPADKPQRSDSESSSSQVSRRDFLRRAAVVSMGAAGVAATGALAGCSMLPIPNNSGTTQGTQQEGQNNSNPQNVTPENTTGENTAQGEAELAETIKHKNLSYTPDKKGYTYTQDDWTFLHVEGEPFDRGYQHGYLLGQRIGNSISQAKKYYEEIRGITWDYLQAQVKKTWIETIDEELFQELNGIVEGATSQEIELSIEDLVVWNSLEELVTYWFPTVHADYYSQLVGRPVTPAAPALDPDAMQTGSMFIATGSYTLEKDITLAHNSCQSLFNASFLNIMLDIVPTKGAHIMMQTAPGCVSSNTGYYQTDAFLAGRVALNNFAVYTMGKTPEFERARMAIQYASTLDEFETAMTQNNKGGCAGVWLIGALETGEIMRLELGQEFFSSEKKTDGTFASSGISQDPRIRAYECNETAAADVRTPAAKSIRMPQLLEVNKGKIDLSVAQKMISDHYDVFTSSNNASMRTICAHYWIDPMEYCIGRDPFKPVGTIDAKVANNTTAQAFELHARCGSACEMKFIVDDFLEEHQQYESLRPYLVDRTAAPWTVLEAE